MSDFEKKNIFIDSLKRFFFLIKNDHFASNSIPMIKKKNSWCAISPAINTDVVFTTEVG